MDPVTLTIVGALGTLTNTALTEAAKSATTDAYNALKKVIHDRFSSTKAPELIETLERTPATAPAAQTAQVQLTALNLASDAEISRLASRLAEVAQLNLNAPTQVNIRTEKFVGIAENKGSAHFDIKM